MSPESMRKNVNELIPNSDIEWLKDNTTIVKIVDNTIRKVVFGDDYHICRYMRDQGEQTDLNLLEKHWNKKWDAFGNMWNEERSNFRLFYESFRRFYFNFEQIRVNKIASINELRNKDNNALLHFNDIAAVHLYGIYFHGKKSMDLIKKMGIYVPADSMEFLNKFRGTRNNLIEHNYNPSGKSLICEPSSWSLLSTSSDLETHIHTKTEERIYDVYFDYYEDYYRLESILVDVIKAF